jgi:RNA polymerase sigma-70 factor (ECF subfamily)
VISTLQMTNVLMGDWTDRNASLRTADDEELIALFLRNDSEEAFETLVRRYQDRIFRLALSILGYGNESEAEDITQEVFVVLFQTLHKFRHESAFSTWFYRMARNRIIDHQRRIVRRASRTSDEVPPSLAAPETAADPLSATINSRRRELLLLLIDQLPEMQRITLRLYYWQDQSTDEIAALLELKPNTVKSHLFRARRNLAAALGEEDTGV